MLKDVRQKKGISQNELSRIANVSQSLICDIENGKVKNPGVQTMLQLAKALECSLDDLVDIEAAG